MTKTAPVRGVPMIRKGPPEIAIEWIDVTIDIRVSHDCTEYPRKKISRGPQCQTDMIILMLGVRARPSS